MAQASSLRRGRSAAPKKKRLIPIFTQGSFDVPFFLLVIVLVTIGLIMVFSSSYVYAYYNTSDHDGLHYIKNQLLFAVIGIIGMMVVSKVNYHTLRYLVWPIAGLTIFLLVLVLLLPALPDKPDFHRWIRVPGIGTFQPSEIAKFAVILIFAHLISINYKKMKTFTYGVLLLSGILMVFAILIFKENHLSGTLLVVAIGFAMMYVGGTNKAWFIAGAIGVAALLLIIVFAPSVFPNLMSHAPERITAWLDKDYSPRDVRWQINQSLYAIGSGGFLGAGIGNSKQKYLYVSEPQNDFIFAIVCEELGFVGAAIIIALFILLIWRGFSIAMKAPDKFGSLLTMGVVFQVGIQTVLNIAVVTDTIPNTGISLPFFSAGGTSLVMLLLEMGVVLAVSRQANIQKV